MDVLEIELFEGEKFLSFENVNDTRLSEEKINDKYKKGFNRIVTEQGSLKLSSLKTLFNQSNYMLKPKFQRRPNWSIEKKSKLIESFIINVPIPPLFLYEKDFDTYEVMDGLQRISSIISFYSDEFELTGLEEWSELNGYKYSKLPKSIKEGIDRRQISTITLLKESSTSDDKAEEMKKMVFERLNTGGVKLEAQEIRNALHQGPFNQLCIDLSSNERFRKLWGIYPPDNEQTTIFDSDEDLETEEDSVLFSNNNLYKRMYDIELVLRFFAMRHVNEMQSSIGPFLDKVLISGNKYSHSTLSKLSDVFTDTMMLCDKIFAEYAFSQYKTVRGKEQWTKAQRAVYDPLTLIISQNIVALKKIKFDIAFNQNLLKNVYLCNRTAFNAKNQSRSDIIKRANLFKILIEKIIDGARDE